MKKKRIGRYIEADPRVCHGQPCFRGTRIMVSLVLELVAMEMDWDAIIKECHGSISRAAIAEAVRFATKSIKKHRADYLPRSMSA